MKRHVPFYQGALIMGLCVLLGLAASPVDYAAVQPAVKVFVNDTELSMYDSEVKKEIPGIIYKNRTLMPLKKTFELFGLEVKWSSKNQVIESQTAAGKKIWLQVNNSQAKVDGKDVTLDVPAVVVNNRTYVPLAFIGKVVGTAPVWDSQNRKVDLYTDGSSVLNLKDVPKAYGAPVRVNGSINYMASDQRRMTIKRLNGDFYKGVEVLASSLFIKSSNFTLAYETESTKVAVYMDEVLGQDRANLVGHFNGNTFTIEIRGESKASAIDIVKNLLN